jgi:FkbM family methyltransferase
MNNARIKILDWLWRKSPLALRTVFLESALNNNIGYLDYDGGKKGIKIAVTSWKILGRLRSCKKEPATVKWIEKYFRPNDVFYDIGANVGAYSFVACAKTKGKIEVYSFEPGFSTYNELYKNIYLNNFQKSIIPINIALSSQTGFMDFNYNSIDSGAAEHKGLSDKSTSQHRDEIGYIQKMATYSLDDLIKGMKLNPPTHIKIDVDGHEYAVLQGAKQTLSGPTIKSIQIEIEENASESKRIVNYLQKLNFTIAEKNQHDQSNIYDFIFVKNRKEQK